MILSTALPALFLVALLVSKWVDAALFVAPLLILGAEFVNGWTDAPNAVATAVGTRTLSPRQALGLATVLNLLGVMSRTAVATTIGTGIIDSGAVTLTTLAGAMIGIITWSSVAARWGIPTSESHALVAGLAGGGLASAGPSALLWAGWKKVLAGLLCSSFLGLEAGACLMLVIYWLFWKALPGKVRGTFRWLRVCSAAFRAFSHGSNERQKFIGAFCLALVLGGVLPSFAIPIWVIGSCAGYGAGHKHRRWRIIRTLGLRMSKLKAHQGFAAETAAARTILLASGFGIPLSTTHTISTAIVGVCVVRGVRAVRWGIGRELAIAWLATFPLCGAISWAAVKIITLVR